VTAREEALRELAGDLARLNVDVILAISTAATIAAKAATSTIPIVMIEVADPVGSGLVASLGHPGGNVTGLSALTRDLSGKRLELLKEAVSGISRVAVLIDAQNPGAAISLTETEVAAKSLGVELQPFVLRGRDEFESVLATVARNRVNGLAVIEGPLLYQHRAWLLELAMRHRLLAVGSLTGFAVSGGLIEYTTNLLDSLTRAFYFVDRILKGAKPADLPVEQPTKFEFVINLKTAKALGLAVPPTLLATADEVIE